MSTRHHSNILCTSPVRGERGVSIIETLVAALLISIAIMATTPVMINGFSSLKTGQAQMALSGSVLAEIDDIRSRKYYELIEELYPGMVPVPNGSVATEANVYDPKTKATMTIVYTARNQAARDLPEALDVKITAVQKRGKFGTTTYEFETVVANLN